MDMDMWKIHSMCFQEGFSDSSVVPASMSQVEPCRSGQEACCPILSGYALQILVLDDGCEIEWRDGEPSQRRKRNLREADELIGELKRVAVSGHFPTLPTQRLLLSWAVLVVSI